MKKIFLLILAGVFLFLCTAHATMIEIKAINKSWTDTGIDIVEGQWIHITAYKRAAERSGKDYLRTPDGIANRRNNVIAYNGFAAEGLKAWSLVGKIVEENVSYDPFQVGSSFDEKSPHTGRLYLIFNDNNYGDNWGKWIADISIEQVPVPTPEPTSLMLLGAGLIGLAGLRKKFKRR